MHKVKIIQKFELIVMLVVLLCSITMIGIYSVREARENAEKFTWQEIKDTTPEYRYLTMNDYISGTVSGMDDYVRGLTTHEHLKDYEYGVIAVVKVKKSRNILATWTSNHTEGRVKLSEIKEPTLKIQSTSELFDHSAVVTDAEILEVLYQPSGKFYHRGQTVRLRENYFIIDQRVPHLLRQVHNRLEPNAPLADAYAVTIDDYIPLEEGEIYLVYRFVNLEKSDIDTYNGAWNTNPVFMTFCLSDPKLAGAYGGYGMEWLTEKYDLSKYLK